MRVTIGRKACPGEGRGRQLDVIVRMKSGLIGRAQLMRAVWTALGKALDNPVRIGGQRPEDAGPALALVCRAPLGAVRFAPLRRWHRGVVRGLGRLAESGFKLGDTLGQGLDLGRLRQRQRDQLGPGEFREFILIHPQVESREYTLVNQNLQAHRRPPTICAPCAPPRLSPLTRGVSSYQSAAAITSCAADGNELNVDCHSTCTWSVSTPLSCL